MKETTITGWAFGVEKLAGPLLEGQPSHRLFFVDGRAGPAGQLISGSGTGEILNVLLDPAGLSSLRKRLQELEAEAPPPLELARSLPPNRAERRAAKGHNSK